MGPDDDKKSSGGQGDGSGGGEKPSAPPAKPRVGNPVPPKTDPGGVSTRWETPKPWKRERDL